MTRAAVLLYDGHCRLCHAGALQLLRWARPGTLELASFHEPGVLARFPDLSHEQCMRALHLVDGNGRVLRAAEAVVAVLLTRGWLFAWARLYYLPGLRTLLDGGYRWLARNRYRLRGRAECTDANCSLHPGP